MTRLQQVKEALGAAESRATFQQHALQLALTTTPDAVERFRPEPGTVYTLCLYGATRAHGGVVIIRFACPGQNDSIDAEYFDAYRMRRLPTEVASACERLAVARQRLLDTDGPYRPGRR